MSFGSRAFVSFIALSFLALFVACSSNSFNHGTPPPSGSFSNSNLNGTYVFSVTGSDSSGASQTIAGVFLANGAGAITGGTLELNNAVSGPVLPQTITGGVYTVGADGRGGFRTGGGLTLQTASGSLTFDFVLSSSGHGFITEFDNNGSGSGTLDLQSTVTQGNIAGSYAFNLSGTSGIGASICGFSNGSSANIPLATVGAFTLDASGNVTAGLEDFNNNCSSLNVTNLPITAGSVSLATVPGTATFTTSAGTFNFHVYPVDSTHLKFIESDSLPILAGDAFTQSAAIPNGANVFTIAGFDSVAGAPFTAAGLFVTDGVSLVTNASAEDINDGGSGDTQVTGFTGSYTALSGGRSQLTLNSFNNGANGLTGNYVFAVYPSTGGLQILEIDNSGTTAGVAYPQTATSVASSQGYGLNLTGANSSSEEDDIAEFTNNNGSFSGLVDFNDQGVQLKGAQKFSATYAPDTTISGRGTVASGSFNLVSYVVDSSTTVFVEVDNNPPQVGIGSFTLQNASAASNAAAAHLRVLRLNPGAKNAAKRH